MCRTEPWTGLPQQIGNVDRYRAGWAIHLARHAIPALVVFHVGLALALIDREHVERADLNANLAALVGDAFFVIDDDRNAGCMVGDRHRRPLYSAATGVLMRSWC